MASPAAEDRVGGLLPTKLLAGGLASFAVAVAAPAPRDAVAVAAEQNRAVLIVDTGTAVKKICVRFWEESISGVELLQRGEVDAALRPYAGKGVAVCSLCGVGCRADDSCLTCDPDGRFWAYSRAPAGTSAFRLSPAGASNTAVGNGDVEGWHWSRGTSPAYVSVAEVCDGAAPAAVASVTTTTPTTPTTAAASAVPAPGPAGNGGSGGSSPATTAPPGAARPATGTSTTSVTAGTPVPTLVGSGASTTPGPTTTPAGGDSSAAAPLPVSSRRNSGGGGGGSAAGPIGFAALVTGILGWAAVARLRRQNPPAG